MLYLDTSALVKRYVAEDGSEALIAFTDELRSPDPSAIYAGICGDMQGVGHLGEECSKSAQGVRARHA